MRENKVALAVELIYASSILYVSVRCLSVTKGCIMHAFDFI